MRPEKADERPFVDWAHDQGALCRKMNGSGFKGWPDQLVIKPGTRRPLWVEFKSEDGEKSAIQGYVFAWLRRLGQRVIVARSLTAAKHAYIRHR